MMFREAVYLPECLDEFLNISQGSTSKQSFNSCLQVVTVTYFGVAALILLCNMKRKLVLCLDHFP
jgi:hypothetical protein